MNFEDAKWNSPEQVEPKSIYDDLQTPIKNTVFEPKILPRNDSRHSIGMLPHTVAVFGYLPEEESNIESMIKKSGNVVDTKRDNFCIYFTFSTHLGAENALKHHMTIVGKSRIAVELQKADIQVSPDALERNSWFSWIPGFY
eukprot:NODE_10_length_61504_cov_0.956502.p47 type:complete len:142 gc:universal NODE_10_length_61504_cov_0.956502:39330-39755(+)